MIYTILLMILSFVLGIRGIRTGMMWMVILGFISAFAAGWVAAP